MVDVVLAVSVQNAVEGPGADLKPSQTGVYIIFNFKIIKNFVKTWQFKSVSHPKAQLCLPTFVDDCLPYMVEPIPWDTSIQGTPPFRGHKIWSWKNCNYIIFVPVTSTEGTTLFKGKEHFSGSPNQFNLCSGNALALLTWLTTKGFDKFKCTLVKMMTAFRTWTISLKSMVFTHANAIHNITEIS